MYQNIRKILSICFLFLISWLSIQIFLPLFFPFFLGGALALAAEPMVAFLSRHIPRPLGTGIGITAALCFLTLTLVIALGLVLRELGFLADMLPDLEQAASNGITALSQWTMQLLSRLPEGMQNVLQPSVQEFFTGGSAMLEQAFRYLLSITGGILRQVPDSALILGTTVISAYMISSKLPQITAWVRARISKERLHKIMEQCKGMKDALFGWLKAQAKLMGVTFLILTMGFILLRVTYAPLWAAAISLVDAFPVLGTGTVLIPWSILCLAQGETAKAVGLLGCYAVVSLSRSILEPKLLGSQLGLDPLVTLAALYAGYQLWGLGGMILAPILAVLTAQLLRPQPDK